MFVILRHCFSFNSLCNRDIASPVVTKIAARPLDAKIFRALPRIVWRAGGAAPNDASKGGFSPCSPRAIALGCAWLRSRRKRAAFDTLPPGLADRQVCMTANLFNGRAVPEFTQRSRPRFLRKASASQDLRHPEGERLRFVLKNHTVLKLAWLLRTSDRIRFRPSNFYYLEERSEMCFA